jgi:hypothetical protein
VTQEAYENIIENLEDSKIIDLMSKLGADLVKDTDKHLIFPTICHNADAADASSKLYYYKNNHLFYCYTECGPMNIFQFLRHYYEVREIEYDWYEDIFLAIERCSITKDIDQLSSPKEEKYETRFKKRGTPDLENYPDKVLDVFVKKYPVEWLNDGITRAAMDKFNILYSISQNKIIIPHYNIEGQLVGVRGRALNEWEVEMGGKYMPVKIEEKWYKHPLSLNLYGLNINLSNIKQNGIVYLFESEKSVLQMEGFDMDNCSAAVCGSSFNKYQLNILLKHCHPKEIVICFDKEEKRGEEKYLKKLYRICEKYKNYCNFSFIYDMENLLDMKDSPTDKGEETFRKLLDRRIMVK